MDVSNYSDGVPDSKENIISKVLAKIKEKISKLFNLFRRFIQKITSGINNLLHKLFKMKTLKINQDYYNQAMDLINKISNLNLSVKEWFNSKKMFDDSKVEELDKKTNVVMNKLENFKVETANFRKITPNNEGRIIVVRTKKLKNIEVKFTALREYTQEQMKSLSVANQAILKTMQMSNKMTDQERYNLLNRMNKFIYFHNKCFTVNLVKYALINMIIDLLFTRQIKDETGIESLIFLCDDLHIVQESELRTNNKKAKMLANRDYIIERMPENTLENIQNKMDAIEDYLDEINYTQNQLIQSSPDIIDHVISILSHVATAATELTLMTSLKKDFRAQFIYIKKHSDLSMIPKVLASSLIRCIGIGIIKDQFRHRTVHFNKEFKRNMINEMDSLYNKYSKVYETLEFKLNRMQCFN